MSTDNNRIDALVYSEVKNTVKQANSPIFKQLQDTLNKDTVAGLTTELDDLLQKSTIKRACCMAKQRNSDAGGTLTENDTYTVKLKLPIPKNYNPGNEDDKKRDILRGYILQDVKVPLNLCKQYFDSNYSLSEGIAGFDKCESFYKAYCGNQRNMYDADLKGEGNDADYVINYSNQECACFIKKPSDLTQVQRSGPNACWAPRCEKDNATRAYLDLGTRKEQCKGTYCINNTNFGNVGAQYQGTVELYVQNSQNCGEGATNKTTSAPPAADKSALPAADKSALPAADKSALPSADKSAPPAADKSPPAKSNNSNATSQDDSSLSKYKYYIGGGVASLCCISIILIIVFLVMRKKKSDD